MIINKINWMEISIPSKKNKKLAKNFKNAFIKTSSNYR